MNRMLATALAVVLGLALAAPARAGEPMDQLKLQVDRVLKTIDDPELKKDGKAVDRRVAVRKIADDIFDFGETAKRSLARHWQGRTTAEQAEFLFAESMRRGQNADNRRDAHQCGLP